MKHYPITVAGKKAAATCVTIGWTAAKVSIKFSHRVGQAVKVAFINTPHDCIPLGVHIYNTRTNTVVEFTVYTKNYFSELDAVNSCAQCITEVYKHVNFNADSEFVTKELLNVFK